MDYTNGNGLFDKLAALFKLGRKIAPFQNDLNEGVEDILGLYTAAELPEYAPDLIHGRNSILSATQSHYSFIKSAAASTIIEYVSAEDGYPMTGKGLTNALSLLRDLMVKDSQTIPRNALGAAITTPDNWAKGSGSNVGSGLLLTNRYAPYRMASNTSGDLNQQDYARAEEISFEVIADINSGSFAGTESFLLKAEPREGSFDKDWPGGSGFSGVVSVTSSVTDQGRGAGKNILYNSDFDDWNSTTNAFGGTETGSIVKQNSTAAQVLHGTYSYRVDGDGSTVWKIHQPLGDATGTMQKVQAYGVYICSIWVYRKSGATGNIRFGIENASGTAVSGLTQTTALSGLDDDAWNNLTFALHTSNIAIGSGFRFFVDGAGGAVSNTDDIYLDELVCAKARRFGRGDLGYIIIRGPADWRNGDRLLLTKTNAPSAWTTDFDRYFNLYDRGIVLPSAASASATIPDSLITT